MSNEIITMPAIEIELVDPTKEVVVITEPPHTILQMTYTAPGPQGKQGIPGPQGDQGIPGTTINYTHVQINAASTWLVEHNLGKHPSISIVDSADTLIIGDVYYLDVNNCRVELSMPVSGKAYCN